MRDQHKLWLGRTRLDREVAELKVSDASIREEVAIQVETEQRMLAEALTQAENLRKEGMRAVEMERWSLGRERFEQALEIAPNGWKYRNTLIKDVAALRAAEDSQ